MEICEHLDSRMSLTRTTILRSDAVQEEIFVSNAL